MFATLCSYPQSTKSMIGNQQANIFDITSFAPVAIHTARTTNTLQSIPLNIAAPKGIATLLDAIFIADSAIGVPAAINPVFATIAASKTEPIKFAV